MLKYFGIAFLAHVIFIVGYVYLTISFDHSLGLDGLVLPYYVWPLFVLPSGGGGSHGGELFVSVISIPINSLIWAYALWTLKRIRSNP
jgi:hypothetical protein